MSFRRKLARTLCSCVRSSSKYTYSQEPSAHEVPDRILRYLAAIALVSEPAPSTYKASHITPHLSIPGFIAGLKHKYATSLTLYYHL